MFVVKTYSSTARSVLEQFSVPVTWKIANDHCQFW